LYKLFQEIDMHFMSTAYGRPQGGGGQSHVDAFGQR